MARTHIVISKKDWLALMITLTLNIIGSLLIYDLFFLPSVEYYKIDMDWHEMTYGTVPWVVNYGLLPLTTIFCLWMMYTTIFVSKYEAKQIG